VVNVGDSRAYLIRDGIIRQITEDHTCVQEMINAGLITAEDAKYRQDKNMITRAVGGDLHVKPDFFNLDVYPGDLLILCSDGLYGEIGDEGILKVAMESPSMHSMAKNLIDAANHAGGKDNVTAVCIGIN